MDIGSVAERVLEATRVLLLIVRLSRAADKQERAASPASPVARHTEWIERNNHTKQHAWKLPLFRLFTMLLTAYGEPHAS